MKKIFTVLAVMGVFAVSGYGIDWAVQGNSWYAMGNAVAVGKDGTLFVTGSFGGYIMNGKKKIEVKSSKPVYTDMFIAAYGPDGKLLWMRTAGGPDSDNEIGRAHV